MSAKSWRFRVYETDESTVDFTITDAQLVSAPTIPSPRVNILEGQVETVSFSIEVGDFSDFLSSKQFDTDKRLDLIGRLVNAQIDTGSGFTTVWKGRWIGATESEGPGKYSVRLADEQWKARNAGIYITQDTVQIWPNLPFGLKSGWGLQEDYASWGPPIFRPANNTLARVERVSGDTVLLKIEKKPGSERVSQSVIDWIKDDVKEDLTNTSSNFNHLRCQVQGSTTAAPDDGDTRGIIRFQKDIVVNMRDVNDVVGSLNDDEPVWPTYVWVAWSTNQPNEDDLYRVRFYADDALTTQTLPLHIGGQTGIDPIQHAKELYDAAGVRYDSDIFYTYDESTNPQGLIDHPLIPKMWWRIEDPQDLQPWLEENVYKPLGLVPFINSDGEIAPKFIFMPQNEDPSTYTTVNKANVAKDGHPTWDHRGSNLISSIRGTYLSGRQADFRQEGDYAADVIEVFEAEVDELNNNRQSTVGDREHNILFTGVWSRRKAERLLDLLAREIFDRFGDGPVQGSFKGLQTLDSSIEVGDFVKIDLDTFPNTTATGGRGGIRVVQILGKEYSPAGPNFDFIDAGPNDQALSAPSVSVTKNASRPTEAVDVAISSLDSDATQWLLQLKKGSGDWENYGVFDVGTTSVTISGLPSGNQITGRARVSAPFRIRSDWSSTNAATLDGLTAPSSLSTTVDGRSIKLTWTNGEDDIPVMPVIMEGTSGTPPDVLKKPLPAGTTEWVFSELAASTQHTLGVYHFNESTGGKSSQTTTTETTSTANTLDEPRRVVILQGRGTNTPDDLAIEEKVIGTGLEIGFRPKETHAHVLVQVATDSGFSSIVSESTVPPGETSALFKNLDLGTTYHVRARHIREGWTNSAWSSTVSAQATRLLENAPQEDNFAAGSARLYVTSAGRLKLAVDADDADTDRVYYEVSVNGSAYPSVDDTDQEITRANLPYDDDALDSGGSSIDLNRGDTVFLTLRFYNDTYGFGSTVKDLIVTWGSTAPSISVDVDDDGGTGSLDLTITDPQTRVTAIEFQKKTDAGGFGGTWLDSWDRSSTSGDNTSLTRGEDIVLHEKHNVTIKYRVQYTDDTGSTRTIERAQVFDVDDNPEIIDVTISFNSSGQPVVQAEGDDDCSNMDFNVGINSDPGGPSVPGEYTVSGTSGSFTATSDVASYGDEVFVVAWGTTDGGSTLGPAKTFRKRRGDATQVRPHVRIEGDKTGTGNFSADIFVDDPGTSVTAIQFKVRQGVENDNIDASWQDGVSWTTRDNTNFGTDTSFHYTKDFTLTAGVDGVIFLRVLYTDENNNTQEIGGSISTSNMEDASGTIRIMPAGFNTNDTTVSTFEIIEDGSDWNYARSAMDGTNDFAQGRKEVNIPPGVTINAFRITWRTTDNNSSVTWSLSRNTSTGSVALYTGLNISSATDAWQTSTSNNDKTYSEGPIELYLSLDPNSVPDDARVAVIELDYTRNSYIEVL